MSISFAKKSKISENLNSCIFSVAKKEMVQFAFDYFIKKFDDHFLKYISYRKQRDLMIVNYFYSLVLADVKISNKMMLKYDFSDLIKNGKNFDFQNIVPINSQEIILNLEQEISILKTFQEIFTDINNNSNFSADIRHIDVKMHKVYILNDDNIIKRLTKSKALKSKIINHLGVVKDYNLIFSNIAMFQSLRKEFDLIVKSKK